MMRTGLLLLSFSFIVAGELTAQCATTTLTCPTTLAGALSSDDCTSYDGSSYDLYQFNGTAGDTITVEIHSTAFDTSLGLINTAGVPVTDNDDLSTSSTDSKITYTLTSSGTWTIYANSLAASKTGDYNLILSCGTMTVTGPKRRAVGKH